MFSTTTKECVGKTITNVTYDDIEELPCRSMYLEFSDGSQMAVGASSDGVLVSCMVPNVPDQPAVLRSVASDGSGTGD